MGTAKDSHLVFVSDFFAVKPLPAYELVADRPPCIDLSATGRRKSLLNLPKAVF